jgi:hypothetical protein
MTPKKLRTLKRQITEMLRSPQGRKNEDLVGLATQLGRKEHNRGKEPTYVRNDGPALMPPLSIPKHSGDMPPGTARSILNQLLSDCDDWEIFLQSEREDDETE